MKTAAFWLGAVCATAVASAQAATPDLSGTWQVVDPPTALRTMDGAAPPLLAAASTTYADNQKARAAHDLTFDTTTRCLPPGTPRIMYMATPFEIIQRDKYLFMLFQYQHLNRQVFLRDQHEAMPLGPRYLGDSIARWDGDTLVVDTTGLKPDTLLDASGLPHSNQMHVVERYTLEAGGQRLRDVIRIEDPKTFAKAWETRVTFKRLHGVAIREDVCTDRDPGWLKAMLKANYYEE